MKNSLTFTKQPHAVQDSTSRLHNAISVSSCKWMGPWKLTL